MAILIEGLLLSDIMTYHKSVVNKMALYWYNDKLTNGVG